MQQRPSEFDCGDFRDDGVESWPSSSFVTKKGRSNLFLQAKRAPISQVSIRETIRRFSILPDLRGVENVAGES